MSGNHDAEHVIDIAGKPVKFEDFRHAGDKAGEVFQPLREWSPVSTVTKTVMPSPSFSGFSRATRFSITPLASSR